MLKQSLSLRDDPADELGACTMLSCADVDLP